jgi:methyl-accepting chemotaxis protein
MNGEQVQESQKRQDASEENGNGRTAESGIVDRIRDILVGSQMHDYDVRLQHLDERLAGEAAQARLEVQKRFEALENALKGEVESLTNRLNAEQSERRTATEKLSHDLAEAVNAFELKIKNLAEYAREIHDLHRQLLEESKALTAKQEQIQAGLNRQAQQIGGTMIGRQTLAEVLSDVALRLKDESRPPGA